MVSFVKHVIIPVKNQDRALSFYTEKLGFKVTTDAPTDEECGKGQRWIELDLPEGHTRLVLFTQEGHESRIGTPQNIIFATHNLTNTYKELKAKGVNFLSEPVIEPWGSYVSFKDSEGNEFTLSEAD